LRNVSLRKKSIKYNWIRINSLLSGKSIAISYGIHVGRYTSIKDWTFLLIESG
jgi:hypothetical protein